MSRSSTDNWNACPRGELKSLSTRLRARRTRRNWARSFATLALVACAGVGAWSLAPQMEAMMDFKIAGIHCSRVLALAQEYAAHKLDPQVEEQIKTHIHRCPRCYLRFKAMRLIMSEDHPGTHHDRRSLAFPRSSLDAPAVVRKLG